MTSLPLNVPTATERRLKYFLALAGLLLFSASSVLADVHPVPLEKNTDSAKCLECHGDKAKGKSVHTAIAAGCTSCHEIRVNKDVTRVKLITTTVSALCFTCHSDKNPSEINGIVHKPANRDCLKCHDPHSSENKNQLLKPAVGAEKENLCLSCHAVGTHTTEKGSRHVALDMGCDTCHETHKTGPGSGREFSKHLKKASPALCLDCHDAKDAELAKAHQNQPFEKADCVACHNPHESERPKLMQALLHPPFADKSCEMCHAPAKGGKVVLAQENVKAICGTCHDEVVKQIETAKVQHPGAMSDCTDCHNPHASNKPGLPKTNGVEICLTCHADLAEQGKKKHPHQPAFQEGCRTCHEPHGSENDHLLRAKDVSALCLECHGPDAPQPAKLENQHVIAIFGGKVRLPENYFRNVPVLPLRYGVGHPTQGHPVSTTIDTKTQKTVAMNCLTCHQPHASAKPGLLAKDQENNMAFCKSCHAEGTLKLK